MLDLDFVEAILTGRAPEGTSLRTLGKGVPHDWVALTQLAIWLGVPICYDFPLAIFSDIDATFGI